MQPRSFTTILSGIFRGLRSVRLALILIVFIAAAAALAAFVPQARSEEFYRQRFGPAAPTLLLLGYDRFFSSPLFLLPAALFSLNLLLCTVFRIIHNGRRRRLSGYGPDLIHIGILILMAAGVVTLTMREERHLVLGEGQSAGLPGGYRVTLLAFDTDRYSDGAVKNWRSTIEISRSDTPTAERTIQVNAPQRVGYLRLYQYSHGEEATAVVSDGVREVSLAAGDRFALAGTLFDVLSVDRDEGLLTIRNSADGTIRSYSPGDPFGGGELSTFAARPVSVLLGVYDPGFAPVLFAVAFILIGLVLTFAPKLIRHISNDFSGESE